MGNSNVANDSCSTSGMIRVTAVSMLACTLRCSGSPHVYFTTKIASCATVSASYMRLR